MHALRAVIQLHGIGFRALDRIDAARPVRAIAQARRSAGLAVDDDYPRLAMVRRALLAGTAPRFLQSEGDPRHLEACLEWLERALVELK